MAFLETKPAMASMTIWGALATLIVQVLGLLHIDIAPEAVMQIIAGIGAGVAIVGRIRATKRIAPIDPASPT